MFDQGTQWAALGPRQLILVALVTLILYGRSGVLRSPQARAILPWLSVTRRRNGPMTPPPKTAPEPSRMEGRLYWFLVITAATAVAAWIVTRTLILSAPGTAH